MDNLHPENKPSSNQAANIPSGRSNDVVHPTIEELEAVLKRLEEWEEYEGCSTVITLMLEKITLPKI